MCTLLDMCALSAAPSGSLLLSPQPIPRQFVPNQKDIKVLCCEEEATALSWTAGIRLAKYGLQLRDNFHKAKMTQFKLEDLTAPDGAKPKAEVRTTQSSSWELSKEGPDCSLVPRLVHDARRGWVRVGERR